MSRQRSGTQSTSGRSSQSSTTRATTQKQEGGGGMSGEQTRAETQAQTGAQTGAYTEAQGKGVTEQAKELAGQVQQKATQRVESGLAKGKTQVAETLHAVNQSLLISGQQLRDRNQQNVSRYVDQLADRVQRAASYLQNTDVSEIVDSTEQFARRRPALFLGGAFALGLLGARFLKSSRRQVAGGAQRAGGGVRSGQGYSRERTMGAEQELLAPRAQEEWAAGRADVAGLADVRPGAQTQPLSESGFGGQRSRLDIGLPPGGPEAAQR
jgi:hypothetical protein